MPPKITASRYLLRRPWMRLREDEVMREDGATSTWHVVEYPDWACVLPLTPDGRIVLVEQHRFGVARACLELPGGVQDDGEAPLDAARRELREETGFTAEAWTRLGAAAPDPARFTNHATVFVATGARRTHAPRPDADERLAVHLLAPDALAEAVAAGAMPHAVHLLGLAWARERGYLPR